MSDLKKGDVVWAAALNWRDEVDVESASVKSVSDKQIALAGGGRAFGYHSRFGPNALGRSFFLSRREALDAMVATETAALVRAEERVRAASAFLAAEPKP